MPNTYTPKVYLLIEWPESKRVLGHPEALFLDDFSESASNSILGGVNCLIPPEIWEQYKDSQYTEGSYHDV